MTVEQFKEKYDALQKEGNDIYAQMKPLLKRLKTLAKRGLKLAEKADGNHELYETIPVKIVESDGSIRTETRSIPDWDTSILFRLWDFEYLVDGESIDAIDNVLYNLKHSKFCRKSGHKGKMVKISLPTHVTSVGTIAIPEEVANSIPPMDM